ncbi:MAG: SPFH/Band 7/PHB domain protein [Anaerolineaceae bacterium]|nr:SPFH/Band 7/PHB domain protein [Anaerolineaceae bacterium]
MDSLFSIANCVVAIIALLAIFFVISAIRIIPEYKRLVIFRLGRCIGAKGPGIIILIPVLDKAVSVDLRELVREIPTQTAITLDNAPISIDFLWYFKLFDPVQSVLAVGDFELAAQGIATTTLRSVIGGILLDDVLSQRERINSALRTRLDEVTERWGVKVTNVEIREITPPRDVQDSMNRQLTAERERRAMVTESTGKREAAINVAQGEKQSSILKAEGEKQASILVAEGERQAQLLRAEGYTDALDKIYSVAKKVDKQTMTLQYFETLKKMGEGASSKFIFPMEFTSMLSDFINKNKV